MTKRDHPMVTIETTTTDGRGMATGRATGGIVAATAITGARVVTSSEMMVGAEEVVAEEAGTTTTIGMIKATTGEAIDTTTAMDEGTVIVGTLSLSL